MDLAGVLKQEQQDPKRESEMGVDYQLHRTSVNIAKGYRQIQKAATAFSKDNADSAVRHLNKALDDFGAAMEHAAKAEDEAAAKAGSELDKANTELQKSIKAYADGHPDLGQSHYESAVESYDKALDLIG